MHEHTYTRTQEHEIAKKWLVSTLIQFYVDIEIMGRDFDGGRCACVVCGVRGMWWVCRECQVGQAGVQMQAEEEDDGSFKALC